MRKHFPSGYHRGACKAAGVSYGFMRSANIWFTYETTQVRSDKAPTGPLGYLKDIINWSREFAEDTAALHGITGGRTYNHWRVIESIRNRFVETGIIPPVFEICEENHLSLKDLMELFPNGYHRGACQIAGLRPLR